VEEHLASATVVIHIKYVFTGYIGMFVTLMQAYSLQIQPHRKKYHEVKSGEQAGHAAVPILHKNLPR
jgi:hypothetical protein